MDLPRLARETFRGGEYGIVVQQKPLTACPIEYYHNRKHVGMLPPDIYTKWTPEKGMGVFAGRQFKPREIIEYCHCVVLNRPLGVDTDKGLQPYVISLGENKQLILPLGYGAMYNCSETLEERNAVLVPSSKDTMVCITASRDIEPDEEILLWYESIDDNEITEEITSPFDIDAAKR